MAKKATPSPNGADGADRGDLTTTSEGQSLTSEIDKGIGDTKTTKLDDIDEDDCVIEALGEFVRAWRRRFLVKMEPKFLPEYWGVENRVVNSTRLSFTHIA